MLVTPDGKALGTIGGGEMERVIIGDGQQRRLRGRRPRTLHFTMGVPPHEGMIAMVLSAAGEVKIFVDVMSLLKSYSFVIVGSGLDSPTPRPATRRAVASRSQSSTMLRRRGRITSRG